MHKFLIGAAIAAVAIAPAVAQKASPPAKKAPQTELRTQVSAGVAKQFAMVDTNKDGSVSQAEMDALIAKRDAKRQARAAKFDPAKAFGSFDANKDGKVTQAEAQAAWTARKGAKGKPADQAKAFTGLFQRADTNKDGTITLAEFSAGARPGAKAGKPGSHRGLLGLADVNKDGKVSLAEAQQSALQTFDRFDANKDGKLTPQERQQVKQQLKAQRKPS